MCVCHGKRRKAIHGRCYPPTSPLLASGHCAMPNFQQLYLLLSAWGLCRASGASSAIYWTGYKDKKLMTPEQPSNNGLQEFMYLYLLPCPSFESILHKPPQFPQQD